MVRHKCGEPHHRNGCSCVTKKIQECSTRKDASKHSHVTKYSWNRVISNTLSWENEKRKVNRDRCEDWNTPICLVLRIQQVRVDIHCTSCHHVIMYLERWHENLLMPNVQYVRTHIAAVESNSRARVIKWILINKHEYTSIEILILIYYVHVFSPLYFNLNACLQLFWHTSHSP